VVKGGPEKKCISADLEAAYKATGRECGRVELPAGMGPEVDILEFLIRDRLKHLASVRARNVARVYGLTAEEFSMTLSRVSFVIADERVSAIISPPVQKVKV
jgi:hypothetical protein